MNDLKLKKISSLEVKRRILLASPCFSLKFSSIDPQILAVSNEDGQLHIYNAFDPIDKDIMELSSNFTQQPINSLTTNEHNPRDYRILRPRTTWQAHYNAIFDIDFIEGRRLVTACGDMTCGLWDIERRAIVKYLIGHQKSVRTVRCMRDNSSIIASGGRDGWLFIYDLRENSGKTVLDNQTMAERLMHPIRDCIFTEGGFFMDKGDMTIKSKGKNKFSSSKLGIRSSNQYSNMSLFYEGSLHNIRRI